MDRHQLWKKNQWRIKRSKCVYHSDLKLLNYAPKFTVSSMKAMEKHSTVENIKDLWWSTVVVGLCMVGFIIVLDWLANNLLSVSSSVYLYNILIVSYVNESLYNDKKKSRITENNVLSDQLNRIYKKKRLFIVLLHSPSYWPLILLLFRYACTDDL